MANRGYNSFHNHFPDIRGHAALSNLQWTTPKPCSQTTDTTERPDQERLLQVISQQGRPNILIQQQERSKQRLPEKMRLEPQNWNQELLDRENLEQGQLKRIVRVVANIKDVAVGQKTFRLRKLGPNVEALIAKGKWH